MNRIAGRSFAVVLLVLMLLAGLAFFVTEYVMEADTWAVFPGSPHVYHAGNIGTGVVTDREGILLLDMRDGMTYSSSPEIRRSVLHWVGDRQGNISAPAVPNYSRQIVGFDLLNGLYSFGKSGSVAELTLSARVQVAAMEALGNRKGTVAVYNYRTGELVCAVTSPTFDPDNVPDISGDTTGAYEGVYLDRFTQGTYTPGSVFKIVTLIAALEEIPDAEQLQFTCTGVRQYGVDRITCENTHGTQTLQEAFCNSCNCAFAELSERLGGQTLSQYVKDLGVTAPVSFDGITTATGNYQQTDEPVDLAWSAIGQYTDLVNPCSFLSFVGAVAGEGRGAVPYVVAKAGDGLSGYDAATKTISLPISRETASKVKQYMRYTVQTKYGDDNFPGLTVCAKTGTAEMDGDKASTAVLTGFVDDESLPLAFFICVEEGGYGRATCVPIASQVLAACKEALN